MKGFPSFRFPVARSPRRHRVPDASVGRRRRSEVVGDDSESHLVIAHGCQDLASRCLSTRSEEVDVGCCLDGYWSLASGSQVRGLCRCLSSWRSKAAGQCWTTAQLTCIDVGGFGVFFDAYAMYVWMVHLLQCF